MGEYTVVLDDFDSSAIYDSVDCETWEDVIATLEKWRDEIHENVGVSIRASDNFHGL